MSSCITPRHLAVVSPQVAPFTAITEDGAQRETDVLNAFSKAAIDEVTMIVPAPSALSRGDADCDLRRNGFRTILLRPPAQHDDSLTHALWMLHHPRHRLEGMTGLGAQEISALNWFAREAASVCASLSARPLVTLVRGAAGALVPAYLQNNDPRARTAFEIGDSNIQANFDQSALAESLAAETRTAYYHGEQANLVKGAMVLADAVVYPTGVASVWHWHNEGMVGDLFCTRSAQDEMQSRKLNARVKTFRPLAEGFNDADKVALRGRVMAECGFEERGSDTRLYIIKLPFPPAYRYEEVWKGTRGALIGGASKLIGAGHAVAVHDPHDMASHEVMPRLDGALHLDSLSIDPQIMRGADYLLIPRMELGDIPLVEQAQAYGTIPIAQIGYPAIDVVVDAPFNPYAFFDTKTGIMYEHFTGLKRALVRSNDSGSRHIFRSNLLNSRDDRHVYSPVHGFAQGASVESAMLYSESLASMFPARSASLAAVHHG